MKKAVLFISLLVSMVSFSQEEDALKEYNELLNYAPKALEVDETIKPLTEKLKQPLNTIAQVRAYYQFGEVIKLNDSDKSLLQYQMQQLAVAFFLEKKYILFEYVGGYAGCIDKMMLTKEVEGNEVTIFRFCHSCTDRSREVEEFISIFNNRMKKLLKIIG